MYLLRSCFSCINVSSDGSNQLPIESLILKLKLPSELKTTYPDAHAILKREVVNKYSLLYTLDGSDPTLSPLLVGVKEASAHLAIFDASHYSLRSSYRIWTLCLQQKRIGFALLSKVRSAA
jgi:hypothetical protein